MPESPKVYYARCPACRAELRQGEACEHITLNEQGQVYELHSQHQFEPSNHAEVWFKVEGTKDKAKMSEA